MSRQTSRQAQILGAVDGVLAAILIVLLVALVTTDGGSGSDASSLPTTATPTNPNTSPPTSSPTADPTDAPAGLARFYGQHLDWQPCGAQQCATLTVPIDYAQPSGPTIGLKLERVLATDQSHRVGSLVVNPGGPGEPGTSMAEDPSFYFGPKLLAREDIVAFDPRGTGGSDPIDCLSDSDLDAFIATDPDPSTPAEGDALVAEDEKFFAGCAANSDSLIGHVSTVEAAKDLDVLRAALSEPKLAYLGFSYGTKLGATYADLFPTKVGRMVLDGAVDPTLGFEQAALIQAKGFETALRSYVQNCLDQGSCFLGTSMQAALTTITDLVASIKQHPLPTSSALGDRQLTAGNALYGIITPLYSKDNWTYLDQGLQQALQGNGSTLLALSDSYSSRNPTGDGYQNNSAEAFPAISCLDDPSSIPAAQVPAQYPAFEKASPTFGRFFAWGLVGCSGIKVEAEQPQPKIDAPGAPPILVLGTTRDPATPLSEAVALAGELDSGQLITRDGDGHTAYNKGNACVDDAVEGYLLDGTVPKPDLHC